MVPALTLTGTTTARFYCPCSFVTIAAAEQTNCCDIILISPSTSVVNESFE